MTPPVMWPRMRDDYEPGSANPGQSLVKSSSQDAWEPGAEPGGGGGAVGVPIFGSQAEAQAWEADNPGQVALWFDSGLTEVTPAAPTADDNADTITIPTTTGVDYQIGGSTVTGTYSVGDVTTSVTVTAVAQSGYVLTGTTSWTFNFTAEPEPGDTPVTPTGPTWTDDTVNGGGSWTTPTEAGVTYSPASGTATPGQTVTVTATATSGYYIDGTSSWQHTFPGVPNSGSPWTANFTAGADGDPVPGFTELWGDPTGTRSLNRSGTIAVADTPDSGTYRYLWAFDAPGVLTDFEVVARVRPDLPPSGSWSTIGVALRASGSFGSETGLAVCVSVPTNNVLRFIPYSAGTPTGSVNGPNLPYTNTDWQWIKIRVVGSAVTTWAWDDGATEPTTPYFETTTPETSGRVGIFSQHFGGDISDFTVTEL